MVTTRPVRQTVDEWVVVGLYCRPHSPRHPACRSQVLSTTDHPLSLFISLVDRRRAVTKFSKCRLWDKVPVGITVIFGGTLISLKYVVA